MTTITRNEGAERLRAALSDLTSHVVYDFAWLDFLDSALEGERRATVERLRAQIPEEVRSVVAVEPWAVVSLASVLTILDEEAAR